MLNYFFNVDEINPDEVHSKIQNDEVFLLDVREPHEYAEIRLENSVLIPRGHLESNTRTGYEDGFEALHKAKNKEVVVICRSGQRSLSASRFLKNNGFSNVKSMKSGVIGWAQSRLPVEGSILQNAPR